MIDSGLIIQDDEGSKGTYRNVSRVALVWERFKPEICQDSWKHLREAVTEPEEFYRHMYSYILLDTKSIGMGMQGVTNNLAMMMATTLVEDLEPKSLDAAMEYVRGKGWGEISVINFLPPTLVVTRDREMIPEVAEILAFFDTRLVCEILRHLTGSHFVPVEDEIYGEGNIRHKFSLRTMVK